MRLHNKLVISLMLAMILVATGSCKYLFKSEFSSLNPVDLTNLTDTLSEQQKRMLAQNESQRKGLVDQLKRAYALAQAAEDQGLDKGQKFKQQLVLSRDQLLAIEWGKKNPNETIPKEEWEAYYAAHKNDFESDIKMVSEGRKQPLDDDLKERQRSEWSELKVRAERGRKAGLEKDLGLLAQLKFGRANLLANLYAQHLEEKLKPTEAEKKKYIAEHPEADLEKLKEKAQGVLERLKKGEDFIKLADEFSEDDGKGRGGELPWFAQDGTIVDSNPPQKMDKEFTNATFALKKGEASKELVKTSFGFHIIRVDDRRMATPPPPPPALSAPPNPSPVPPPTPREEIHARHIIIATQEADSFEGRMTKEKISRAIDDAALKYPVNAPTDFKVNVAGFDPNRRPGLGGGQSGPMRGIQPGENK